jgi:hypothetical protein
MFNTKNNTNTYNKNATNYPFSCQHLICGYLTGFKFIPAAFSIIKAKAAS